MNGEHAQTSHRRRRNDPCRAPGAMPCQTAPAGPHSARSTDPTHPAPAKAVGGSGGRAGRSPAAISAWLDNLPQNLEGSRLADRLQTIVELDLEELQAIDPPRGYGRD